MISYDWPKTHSEQLLTPSSNHSLMWKGHTARRNRWNQADLENGTSAHIVSHLEREPELNDSEAADELQVNTLSHQTEFWEAQTSITPLQKT